MVDDGAPSDLVNPGAKTLIVTQPPEATLHPQKDVLHHVVDVHLRTHAARDEGPQLDLELAPGAPRRRFDHAEVSGAQQVGPQHDLSPCFTASMVAEAT